MNNYWGMKYGAHGGSGFGDSIKDTKKYTSAEVSDIKLSVYDMEAVNSLNSVVEWLKTIK